MQEKSLPFFRQPQKDQNNENPQQTYGLGSNLVFLERDAPYNAVHLRVLTRTFIKLNYFIAVSFLILMIVNWAVDLKLQSQKILLNHLADQVGNYSLVRSQAIDLDKKIKFYAQTLSMRSVLGEKSQVIFSNLNDSIDVKTATIKQENFVLEFEVESPLIFAQLAYRYLKDPLIASITLRTAELNPSTKMFNVVIEGTYSK